MSTKKDIYTESDSDSDIDNINDSKNSKEDIESDDKNDNKISKEDIETAIKSKDIETLLSYSQSSQVNSEDEFCTGKTFLEVIWNLDIENLIKAETIRSIITNTHYDPYSEHSLVLNILEWLFCNEYYYILDSYIDITYKPNRVTHNMTDVLVLIKIDTNNKQEKLRLIQKMISHVDFKINIVISDEDTIFSYMSKNITPDIVEIYEIILSHFKNINNGYLCKIISGQYTDDIKIIISKMMIDHPNFDHNSMVSRKKNYQLTMCLFKKHYQNENTMAEIALHYIKHPKFNPNFDASCSSNGITFFLTTDYFTSKQVKLKIMGEFFMIEKFDPHIQNRNGLDFCQILLREKPVYYQSIFQMLIKHSNFDLLKLWYKITASEKLLATDIISDCYKYYDISTLLSLIVHIDKHETFFTCINNFIVEKIEYYLDTDNNIDDLFELLIDKCSDIENFGYIFDLVLNHPNNKKYYLDNNDVLYYIETKENDKYHFLKSYTSSKNIVKIYYGDGNYYEGEINETYQKHGFGKYHYGARNHYEGQFFEDKFCGNGYSSIFHINNSQGGISQREIYKGMFNNDERYGYGKLVINNMTREGFFESNQNGIFVTTDNNETRYENIIENDTIAILDKDGFDSLYKKQCHICTSFIDPKKSSYCGNNLCTQLYCNDCVHKIYNEIEPGTYITETKKKCKYCSRFIQSKKILEQFNDELKRYSLDQNEIYGYCRECKAIEKTEISCDTENLNDYMCTSCLTKKGLCKKCPSCDINIIKNGGCNHMTCKCNYEWCWECMKKIGSCNH